MAQDITLTSAMRTNLVSLQNTNMLMSQTQQRLSTGKKVNSALDNPTNFFAASAHLQRANDLSNRKDGMTEAVQAVQASNTGITGVQALLQSAKGVLETARTTSTSGLSALYKSFNTIAGQVNQLINDSGYKGTNFLNGTAVKLDVAFNETGSNKLTINGFNAKVSGLLNSAVVGSAAAHGKLVTAVAGKFTNISAAGAFSAGSNLNAISNALTVAISALQSQSSKMAANLSIVNARLDFTTSMVNVEKTGSDNLTLADTNEEGANMLMLQTRTQLGTTALSLASQSAQAVLKLF